MSGQRYAEPTATTADTDRLPAGTPLPPWRITARRVVLTACERAIGECFVPNAGAGLAILGSIVALLAVIAVTLSVGNALLVLLVAIVMRILCERRN
jgi:hypothetical protein